MKSAKLEKIRIIMAVDDTADLSTLGELTDKFDDSVIIRAGDLAGKFGFELTDDDELPNRSREYRYFKPYAGGEKPGTDEYRQYGLQDWNRIEGLLRGDWQYLGIWLEAIISVDGVNQTIRSGGLWGIESDCKEYIEEVIADESVNLIGQLAALHINKRNFKKLLANADKINQ